MIQRTQDSPLVARTDSTGERSTRGPRATWNRPVLKALYSSEALTGVNSTTDATNTFS